MKQYIFIILFVLSASCTRQKETTRFSEKEIQSLELGNTSDMKLSADSITTIDLNRFLKKQTYEFGSLIDEMKLIPLETSTDESLLAAIHKIIITDSNIYIQDRYKGGGIVIFNQDGKFIKRISHGHGPGEISRLQEITYDPYGKKLIVYTNPFLITYTSNGELLEQIKIPFAAYNIAALPNGYIFKTLDEPNNVHLGKWKDCTLLITDDKLALTSAAFPVPSCPVNYGGYHYLYPNDDAVNVTMNFGDTIYEYKVASKELKIKYILDYNEKKLPDSYLKEKSKEFHSVLAENDYYFYLGEYLETESNNAFFLENKYIGRQTIVYRDKRTGNLIGGTYGLFHVDNEIPPIGLPRATVGEYFVSIHQPNGKGASLANSSILSSEDKLKIKDLNEDDNPVLVLYRLKEF